MTNIRKASSTVKRVVKKSTTGSSVRSTRQPSTIEEMGDTSISSLGPAQDGFLLSYNASIDKFELVDADTVVTRSIEDENLPQDFIDVVESQLDLGEVAVGDIDGGAF